MSSVALPGLSDRITHWPDSSTVALGPKDSLANMELSGPIFLAIRHNRCNNFNLYCSQKGGDIKLLKSYKLEKISNPSETASVSQTNIR